MRINSSRTEDSLKLLNIWKERVPRQSKQECISSSYGSIRCTTLSIQGGFIFLEESTIKYISRLITDKSDIMPEHVCEQTCNKALIEKKQCTVQGLPRSFSSLDHFLDLQCFAKRRGETSFCTTGSCAVCYQKLQEERVMIYFQIRRPTMLAVIGFLITLYCWMCVYKVR